MIRFIFFITFSLISTLLLSQSKEKPTIFDNAVFSPNHSISINVNNLHHNVIGELKDELLSYKDKINNVDFYEDKRLLEISYNQYMLTEDLKMILDKYEVNYYIQKDDSDQHLLNTK